MEFKLENLRNKKQGILGYTYRIVLSIQLIFLNVIAEAKNCFARRDVY